MTSSLQLLPKKRQAELRLSFDKVARTAREVITPAGHDRFVDHYLDIQPPTFAHLLGRACYCFCTACTNTKNANSQWSAARDYPWTTQDELAEALTSGGCQNKKADLIWRFVAEQQHRYRAGLPMLLGHPVRDMGIGQVTIEGVPTELVAWHQARLRLVSIPGIGWKLASMCLQMFCPFDCPLLVVDTWFARKGWYDIDPDKPKEYRAAEDHWIALCKEEGWVTGIAREIFWDRVGQERLYDPDNGWWSNVVRDAPVTPLVNWLRDMPYPIV